MHDDRANENSSFESIYLRVNDGGNAIVLAQSAAIAKQSEEIRRLEEITRQVDTPYIGSYFSA